MAEMGVEAAGEEEAATRGFEAEVKEDSVHWEGNMM